MSEKNILYISYDGMTDPLGQSQVIPYLIGLTKKGFRFTILSCEKPAVYAERKSVIESILKENNIHWEPLEYTASPPVLSTLKDIKSLKKKTKEIVQSRNISLLHCRSYISAIIGLYAKKKFNLPFVFDMRGFWADERVEGSIWSLGNPVFKQVYKFFKKKELQYFQEASYTISLTEAGKREIHSWKTIKNNPIPIQVIPCCADLEHFNYRNISPEKTNSLKKELGIPEDATVISYLGSVGTWYMLPQMLEFFKALSEANEKAVLFFISADSKDKIVQQANALGIADDKIFVKKANREDVPLYISLSTASLFFIKPVFSKTASSPTKMGEVMGMGVPIICNSGVGDVAEIVNKTKCGVAIDSFSPMDYNNIINKFAGITALSKDSIREGAKAYYSLEDGVEKYAQVYNTIIV